MRSQSLAWTKSKACPLCASNKTLDDLHSHDDFVLPEIKGNYFLIEIREQQEVILAPLPEGIESRHIPLSRWENKLLDKSAPSIVVCAKGIRSHNLVNVLRGQGYSNAYLLRGGIESQWS